MNRNKQTEELSDEWKAEIDSRLEELDNGTATTTPYEEIKEKYLRKYK
jgi:putative addiction module component (TIGR02574 family)